MRVLITGGAGYIGTELTYALEHDPTVSGIVLYDNLSRANYNLFLGRSKLTSGKVRLVKGELLDSRKLRGEVEHADVIVHLAAKVTTPFADHNPHEFDQVNNWGTAELTYLMEAQRGKKLIYASSASTYGQSEKIVNVDHPLNPKTFYGISKMHGEEHVSRLRSKGLIVLILRLGNVYGYSKSMRFDSVINKFMFDANFGKRLRIYGDGKQLRSFIHISRLTKLLRKAVLEDRQSDTFNMVENTFSINDIIDELKQMYPKLEMVFVNQNMKMRSLNVAPDPRIPELHDLPSDILTKDLQSFKANFTF